MYNCVYCNYSTKFKPTMNNHNKSLKHITNKELYENKSDILIQKNEQIELLKIKYYKVKKQKKKIQNVKQELENEKQEIEQEKQEIEKKLLEREKEKIALKAKLDIYREFAEKPKTVNNNVYNNNMNYVNKNYKDAPALKKITNYIIDDIDLNNDTELEKISNRIVYSYNNKSLHKYIGDHIIKTYKKEDKSQQSFHATDVARRKYLVKLDDDYGYLYDDNSETSMDNDEETTENKKVKTKWVNDNNGVKISYLVYEPVLKKLLKQLKKCCSIYAKKLKNNEEILPKELEKFTVLNSIVLDMDKKKISNDINKYIAPHFELNRD